MEGKPLEFSAPVTIIAGENGSGKSSLLEAIASCCSLPIVGSQLTQADSSLGTIAQLKSFLRLAWSKKRVQGMFFRAEDYFGFVKRVDAERQHFKAELQTIDDDDSLTSFARAQARMTRANSLAAYSQTYGEEGLDVMSHGESFLAFFSARLKPGGLYILDEPEAALSPMRCLGLIALIKPLLEARSTQIIIATHSPILMAIPQAQILYLEDGIFSPCTYDELPHVTFKKDFMRSPERFLRHL